MNFGTKHIKIFVYAEDHPPPHCHVVRTDKSVTRVVLPTLKELTGAPLSRIEKDLILKRLDEICEAYDEKNPKKHKYNNDE